MMSNYLLILFFVGFTGVFLYSTIRNRGFKGAVFGAPIASSLGEVSLMKRSLVSQKLKVHILGDASSTQFVGLELRSSGLGVFSMMPLRLTREQALAVITLLERAVAGLNAGPDGRPA